jgi:hypothetical protein
MVYTDLHDFFLGWYAKLECERNSHSSRQHQLLAQLQREMAALPELVLMQKLDRAVAGSNDLFNPHPIDHYFRKALALLEAASTKEP